MRRLLLIAVVSSLALTASPAVASSSTLHLPRPTGAQPVGTTSVYLKVEFCSVETMTCG